MISVRRANDGDADAIWELVGQFGTEAAPARAGFDTILPAVLRAPDQVLLVAHDDDGVVVGYLLAATHLTFLAGGPVVWVEEVCVANSHRRSGIGRSLMTHIEEWAESLGAAHVALASRRSGPFYDALGFADAATFYKRTVSRPALSLSDP